MKMGYVFSVLVIFAILLSPLANTISVNAQILGNVTSTTSGTLNGTTSTLNNLTTGMLNSTTSTLNNLTSGTLNNLTSTLNNLTGTLIFPNGTLFTLVNGVPMTFLLDPNKPSLNDPTVTVNALDQSGNPHHMYIELQDLNGNDIASGYTPISFSTNSGQQYIVHANNYQSLVFSHWDDGTTNPARSITPTHNLALTAYYDDGSTGGTGGTGSTANSIALSNIQSTSGTVSSSPYQLTLANVNGGTGSDNLLVVGVSADNHSVASVTFGGTQL